jgi:hypothetical protein
MTTEPRRKPFIFKAHNGGPPRELSAQDIIYEYVHDESVATRVTVKLHDLGVIDDQSFLDIIRPVPYYGDISIRNERDNAKIIDGSHG